MYFCCIATIREHGWLTAELLLSLFQSDCLQELCRLPVASQGVKDNEEEAKKINTYIYSPAAEYRHSSVIHSSCYSWLNTRVMLSELATIRRVVNRQVYE